MEGGINIGDLDTLVTLCQVTETIGAQGQHQKTFTDYANVYAKVERNVDETVSDGNLEAGQNLRLTLYKVSSFTARWQIKVDNKPYEVTSIDPISRISPVMNVSLHAIDG